MDFLQQAAISFLTAGKRDHTDHLNTTRLIADAAGTTVWRWDQAEPFGVNVPDENPSGLGVFDLPLRLPGQYFDKETNLHYNYFRDYDPAVGRYVQSDPIGLESGPNTYLYALASSLAFIDPRGLVTGKIDGEVVRVHKNDMDKWPSDPHGHVLDKNQVVDKDGNVYDKTTRKRVGKVSKKGMEKLRDLFKKIGKGLLCVPMMVWDTVDMYCQANPGDPACIFVNPPDPTDPCRGNPLCG